MIEFTFSDNCLSCIIQDNGIGQEKAKEIKEKRLNHHTVFSIESIQDRVQFLAQTLKNKI